MRAALLSWAISLAVIASVAAIPVWDDEPVADLMSEGDKEVDEADEADAVYQSAYPTTVTITRHATSCNNAHAGKSIISKDYEPSLSTDGMTGAYGLAPTFNFVSRDVDVSCLIRTWETAYILYGYQQQTLILTVNEFLKEAGKTLTDRGNFYKPPPVQLLKFLKFLEEADATDAATGAPVYGPNTVQEVRIVFPGAHGGTAIFRKAANVWTLCEAGHIDSHYYDHHPRFAQTGNIVEYINSLGAAGGHHYAVAHSAIMRDFVDNTMNHQAWLSAGMRKENSWSMTVRANAPNNFVFVPNNAATFRQGFRAPRPPKLGPIPLPSFRRHPLCGWSGKTSTGRTSWSGFGNQHSARQLRQNRVAACPPGE